MVERLKRFVIRAHQAWNSSRGIYDVFQVTLLRPVTNTTVIYVEALYYLVSGYFQLC